MVCSVYSETYFTIKKLVLVNEVKGSKHVFMT